MKHLLLTLGIVFMTGLVHATDNQAVQAQANDAIFTEPVQVQALSTAEMQETKAGAIYLRHESIKGN